MKVYCSLAATAALLSASVSANEVSRAERAIHRGAEKELIRDHHFQAEESKSWGRQLLDSLRDSHRLERDALVAGWETRTEAIYQADKEAGRYAHEYVTPVWLSSMRKFYGDVSSTSDFRITHSGKAFSDEGDVVERPQLRMGKNPRVRNLLLASELSLQTGSTLAVGSEFLSDLANTEIKFCSEEKTREVHLTVYKGLCNNKVQIGAYAPIVERIRTLRMRAALSEGTRARLKDRTIDDDGFVRNSSFRELFGVDVESFVQDLVEQRGMEYQSVIRDIALESYHLFATTHLTMQGIAQWTLGAELILPGIHDTNFSPFYHIERETEDSYSLRCFTGLVTKEFGSGWCLHGMASLRTFFPHTVTRRVPRMVSLHDVTALSSAESYYEELTFDPARTVFAPETTINDFASQTTNVAMRLGSEVDVRFGCVIPHAYWRSLKTDIYAGFLFKSGDELQSHLSQEEWYGDGMVVSGARRSGMMGVLWTYQPSARLHLRGGIEVTIFGRSMPYVVGGTLGFSWDW